MIEACESDEADVLFGVGSARLLCRRGYVCRSVDVDRRACPLLRSHNQRLDGRSISSHGFLAGVVCVGLSNWSFSEAGVG